MKLFEDHPQTITNTLKIAEQCEFDLATGLGYTLPEPAVPSGYTAVSYLRRLCSEAALRRYGTVTPEVDARLDEEFHLISRHRLAGFLLLYREIVLLAQKIMEEKGLSHPETPLEERPPGRGRGSSVALLVGYLIGISHVDPLRWGLTLERFIPEDMTTLPDIDLDFPRALRDELIERVHRHFGPEFAVLAGAVSTYSVKGIIQDLGKALGLPKEDLRMLSRQLHSHDAQDLKRMRCWSSPPSGRRCRPPAGATSCPWPPSLCTLPGVWASTWGAWSSATPPYRRWCPYGRVPLKVATSWTGTRTAPPTLGSPR